MLLRHCTVARNLPGIARRGLLCAKSRGKLKAVWLCPPSQTSWAVLHVVKRHGGRVEDAVVLEIDVPRGWLRRSRKRLWYTLKDVPPERIKRILTFQELAGSSGTPAGPA
jgi:hypothetical protein